ncbi:ent-kaurenoic acid oxidase 1-like [Bidens hawaiensis]|uniref:ent-kaurenoic acid oxidase 1-like n=1 Tax=Bidens hawaiensis TaxID=980011 RepID=UPI00404991FB
MWLAVVSGVVPLLIWLLSWWNDVWYGLVTATLRSSEGGTDLPPGYMGLPIIGETFTFLWYFKFLRRPDDYINSKRSKFGDGIGIYKTHLFGRPSVIVFSPTATRFVFRAEESFILEWPNVELVGKTSVASVHGKTHARLRSFVIRSVNQPDALRRIASIVQPRIISALDYWAKRHTITSYKEIKKVTFENIGMYFASFHPGPTLDMLGECFTGLVRGIRSYPLNIPGFAYYHGLRCRRKAIEIFKEELKKRRNNFENESNESVKDLMDGLMRLKDEEGAGLSDIEILDNIVSILIGGYESTTLTMMWAVYYLAKYPEVLQKLRDENMSLKSSKDGQFITSDEILKMKYTMKVVDETIRMANIAPFLFRTTTKDVTYKGHTIPKGWNVMLWIRYLHTAPENFNDPLCFNPDRWDVSMAPGTYHVFGGGSRICAGNMLARLQVAIFLYHLSTGYKWKLVNPNSKVKYLSNPKPEDGAEITIEKLEL